METLGAQLQRDEGGGGGSWCVEAESGAAAPASITERWESKNDDNDVNNIWSTTSKQQ